MILNIDHINHFYLICGYTDGRKNIDSLAALVSDIHHIDPFSNSLFLFCNKKRNTLKVLHWDENGFELLSKKLAEAKFQWPKDGIEARNISKKQLNWLLEGLSIDEKKAFKEVHKMFF